MAVSLQNHIHISTTLADVTTPVALSEWKITGWKPSYEAWVSMDRTFGGTMYPFAALTNAGAVLLAKNLNYRICLEPVGATTLLQRLTQFEGLIGKTVYVHDIFHDSAAHGTGYRTMFFEPVESIENLDPMIQKIYVDISLKDKNP